MHKEILNVNQIAILDLLKIYKNKYYLVGGTAIAFYLGHRESIDFDLFIDKKIEKLKIKNQILQSNFKSTLLIELPDQIHFIINEVKLTFFQFPHKIESPNSFEDVFKLPDLLSLAAMKAYALGGRGKWKDYVDLYFIIKNNYSVESISIKAKELFTDSFNPILFKKQLCYFGDINYSENVNYLPGFETDEQTIKDFLTEVALQD